ncbi:MAG: ribonuclease P protein component [Verrucomicrobia bacterium]|nr:ribonuclease P protein component [Verrucomicrobiota bacterium]
MRFRPEQHLRRQGDFDHVRATGRRYDAGAFVVFHAPRRVSAAAAGEASVDTVAPVPAENVAPARAGFVASRSAVGNAVARARAKRRLREGFRACQAAFPAGYDFIFVARRSLNGLEHAALEERFSTLCRKLFPSSAH